MKFLLIRRYCIQVYRSSDLFVNTKTTLILRHNKIYFSGKCRPLSKGRHSSRLTQFLGQKGRVLTEVYWGTTPSQKRRFWYNCRCQCDRLNRGVLWYGLDAVRALGWKLGRFILAKQQPPTKVAGDWCFAASLWRLSFFLGGRRPPLHAALPRAGGVLFQGRRPQPLRVTQKLDSFKAIRSADRPKKIAYVLRAQRFSN